MSNEEDLKKIKSELEKKIRVSVVWDGLTSDPEAEFEADILCGTNFTANQIVPGINASVGSYEDGNLQFIKLKEMSKELDKKITKWAKEIQERGGLYNTKPEEISDKYYEISAKKFEQKYKKDCVLVAPHHWLPV